MSATHHTTTPEYDRPYSDCPLCRSNEIALHHCDFRGNRIFLCNSCGAQFMNPVYSDNHLTRYYADYYGGDAAGDAISQGQEKTNQLKFRAIERFVPTPGKVLDFGCGNGNFIETALAQGWQAIGYDVDCDAMQRVSKRLGVPVRCGELSAVEWPAGSFDLVHAHHVVEHLKHPVRDISRLSRWLKPGGYFYVAVPNIDSAASRFKFRLEKMGLRRKRIGRYYDSDHHVFYYSPTSMRSLLERCGFEVLMTMNGNKSHISASPVAQFFSYTLTNYLYASAAFFMIARKIREA